MKDNLMVIGTAFDGTVRLYIANTINVIKDASKKHSMYPTGIAALGRTLTITLIMGQMLKGDQTIAVKVEGGGPLGKIVCESDTSGNVMGYVSNGEVYLKYNNGKLAVGDAVGRDGFITVVKDLHLKEPFTSSTPIVSGEIAEDFTYYFAVSEQTPSSVSLGVLVGLNNEVLSSGGFVVQIMPGCKDETLSIIEENLKKIKPISELLVEGKNEDEIAELIVGKDNFKKLKEVNVGFKCRCSKESFYKSLKTLGYDTIKKMYDEDKQIEATCQYCGEKYIFNEQEVKDILDSIKK